MRLVLTEARRAESKGGKSELRRAVRRVTPGRGNPKDSGTENIPPFDSALRASLTASLDRRGLALSEVRRAESKGKGEKVR
jgi:hypothetical protein